MIAFTTNPATDLALRQMLQEFYGRRIARTADLETNACCDVGTMSRHSRVVEMIPAQATDKYLGCGSPIPDDFATMDGISAVDLGSGSGVDAMILRYYLGPTGRVRGIDMTEEQVSMAQSAGGTFMKSLGYAPDSLSFEEGFIETAETIPDASVDLVISNCVINLSPRQDLVYRNIARILKPGGELFISDIVSSRRTDLSDDSVLVAECIGMAPYINDARDMLSDAGFVDARVHSRRTLGPNARLTERGELATFESVVWRGFKLDNLDRRCEDYGQLAVYSGLLPGSPGSFILDEGHVFETGRPVPVCRNTARMLTETRFAKWFEVTRASKHFGLFAACGTPGPAGENAAAACC